MNGKLSKKLRKLSKQDWFYYVKEIKKWPLTARLRYCWYVIFGKRQK